MATYSTTGHTGGELLERPYGVELYENEELALGDPKWQIRNGVLGYIEQLEAENKELKRQIVTLQHAAV